MGGGHYAPEPGTGIWKTVPEGLTCRAIDEVGSDPFVSFQVAGLHLNAPLDGCYRVTPRLKGPWHPAGKLASLSYRSIEPISASVALKKERPVQSVSFEVIRRSVLTGRRLD